jgi:hypothetical protein
MNSIDEVEELYGKCVMCAMTLDRGDLSIQRNKYPSYSRFKRTGALGVCKDCEALSRKKVMTFPIPWKDLEFEDPRPNNILKTGIAVV